MGLAITAAATLDEWIPALIILGFVSFIIVVAAFSWRRGEKRSRAELDEKISKLRNASPEEKDAMVQRMLTGTPHGFEEIAGSLLLRNTFAPRIVTCRQGIVTYVRAPNLGSLIQGVSAMIDKGRTGGVSSALNPDSVNKSLEKVDQKIRDILSTNPKTNLNDYEEILGIKILKFEPANIHELDSGDIELGELK